MPNEFFLLTWQQREQVVSVVGFLGICWLSESTLEWERTTAKKKRKEEKKKKKHSTLGASVSSACVLRIKEKKRKKKKKLNCLCLGLWQHFTAFQAVCSTLAIIYLLSIAIVSIIARKALMDISYAPIFFLPSTPGQNADIKQKLVPVDSLLCLFGISHYQLLMLFISSPFGA